MEREIRKSGIKILGDVRWGSHFCQFYQSREDLIEVLIPYFKAGLENNEFCMWITSKPLKVEEAKASLKKAINNLDSYIKKGQIEIVDASQWYTKSGKFVADKVLQGWVKKEEHALKRGFDGLRCTGDTLWVGKKDWRDFAEYEVAVNNVIGKHRMIAICSYSLDKCGASEVIDVVNSHQFALIRREGKWELIESSERKRAEEALRESEKRFRAIFDNVIDGILLADTENKKFYSGNKTICQMLGYSLEEIKNLGVVEIHPKEDLPYVIEQFEKQVKSEYTLAKDIPVKRKDGNVFYADINSSPITLGGKTYLMGVFRDSTERKRAEEQIRTSLKEKEVLLEEVHHRVKNNMQIISSLLNLQSRHIKDKRAFEIFKSSHNRIRSMAIIHERLYQSKEFARVNFAEYVRSLTGHLLSSHGINPEAIKLNINIKDFFLDINTAIPCSLIINELVSNSFKHAFPRGKKGEIKIAMHPLNKDEIDLIVSDNGVGIPEEVDFRNTESLGLHLVNILAEDQLQGDVKLDRTRGTSFHIRFRMKK